MLTDAAAKKRKAKSQKSLVLEYIERNGSITPLEAQKHIGCLRLGARIWDLKHDGYNIVTEMVRVPTRRGWAFVARYSLAA